MPATVGVRAVADFYRIGSRFAAVVTGMLRLCRQLPAKVFKPVEVAITHLRPRLRGVPNSVRVTKAPSLRWRPLRVSGTPMLRLICDFIREMPRKRRQEKPPRFIGMHLLPHRG
jgi:hypothetical protein